MKNPFVTVKIEETVPKYFFSTGSTLLDYALSEKRAGIGSGRVTQIYGDEATGKTLLAVEVLADAQRKGGIGIFLDAESTLDLERAKKICGLSLDKDVFCLGHPHTVEEIFEIYVEAALVMAEKKPVVIVIDSLSSLPSNKEITQNIADNVKYPHRARVVSTSFRQYMPRISKAQLTLIFVGQTRIDPTMMFGDNRVTDGGKALGFYSSHIILLKRKKILYGDKDKKNPVGVSVEATVKKTKLASPLKKVEFDILFNYGVDNLKSMAEFIREQTEASKYGMIDEREMVDSYSDKNVYNYIKKVEESKEKEEIIENLKQVCWILWEKFYLSPDRPSKYL